MHGLVRCHPHTWSCAFGPWTSRRNTGRSENAQTMHRMSESCQLFGLSSVRSVRRIDGDALYTSIACLGQFDSDGDRERERDRDLWRLSHSVTVLISSCFKSLDHLPRLQQQRNPEQGRHALPWSPFLAQGARSVALRSADTFVVLGALLDRSMASFWQTHHCPSNLCKAEGACV